MGDLKQKILACAKWRWEFVRRNPDYRKDYERICKQRESLSQEKAFCDKWQIDGRTMPDPTKSWEQLRKENTAQFIEEFKGWHGGTEVPAEFSKLIEEFEKDNATRALVNGGVRIIHGRMGARLDLEPNNLSANDLILHIDFNKINSIADLKKYVAHIIEGQAEIDLKTETGPFIKNIEPMQKRAKKYGTSLSYEEYLTAWDMKNSGADYAHIFKKLDPVGYKRGYTENERKRVKRIIARCEELILGGYKRITYP